MERSCNASKCLSTCFSSLMQIATASSCSHAEDTCAATPCNVPLLPPSFPLKSQAILLAIYETTPHSISMEEDQKDSFILPTPSHWIAKLLSFQADLIHYCMVSLFSPIHSLFTVTSESYHRDEETKDSVESAVHSAPSHIAYGSIVLLKKLGLCFLSAAYVCMILTLVLIVASVVGVCLVRLWVEEPVFVKEKLHFDYTDAHPTAVFSFSGEVSGSTSYLKKKQIRVPVGHTFSVSLALLMPESDFNRELGVFQVYICLCL